MSLENLINEQSNPKKQNPVKKLWEYGSNYVNYKVGSISGLVGGGIVYYINSDHGFWPATGGFTKQFLYNVFVAGFNVKTCEKLAKQIKSKPVSIIASTIIPTTQAFAITYLVHKLGGTPEAFDSSIWQVYVNLPTFLGLGIYYRRGFETKLKK